YIRAPKVLIAKILARPANGTEGHLRERTFGRVCWLVAGNPLHPCDAGFVAFSLSRNVLWWPNCSKHPCGANHPRGHIIAKMIDRMAVRTETDERQGIRFSMIANKSSPCRWPLWTKPPASQTNVRLVTEFPTLPPITSISPGRTSTTMS